MTLKLATDHITEIPVEDRCPRCGGTGEYRAYGKCFACNGTGIRKPQIKEAPRADSFALSTERLKPIMDAIETAKKNGIPFPKVRLADNDYTFTISLAGPDSRNPGAIYVKEGNTYLGKIIDGIFKPSYDCTPIMGEHLASLMEKPLESAIAYGRKYGRCSICGRTLTNHESIARGIGPICAANMGWGA